MALPTGPSRSWRRGSGLPSRLFDTGRTDYELHEEDGEFVLNVELPGYEMDEIDLTWDDGILNIAAEHEDEKRGERETYHQRFRFPKNVEDEAITARYRSGILEVRLPVQTAATARGREIEIES